MANDRRSYSWTQKCFIGLWLKITTKFIWFPSDCGLNNPKLQLGWGKNNKVGSKFE